MLLRALAAAALLAAAAAADTTPPTITCPGMKPVFMAAGKPYATLEIKPSQATVTDNCGSGNNPACVTVTAYNKLSPGTLLNGNVNVLRSGAAGSFDYIVFKAKDSSGNEASCQQLVMVIDAQQPVLTAPNAAVVPRTKNTDAGKAYATMTIMGTQATVVDNSGETLTASAKVDNKAANGELQLTIGAHTVVYTASDSTGQTGTVSFSILIKDVEKPTITCPYTDSLFTVSTDAGQKFATVDVNATHGSRTATVGDNSGVISSVITKLSDQTVIGGPTKFDIGTTIVTYVVSDPSSNTAVCSVIFKVVDTEAPVLVCPANAVVKRVVSTDTGKNYATQTVTGAQAAATDNSGESVSTSAFTMVTGGTEKAISGAFQFPLGVTTVIYYSSDSKSNRGNCSFTVEVKDTEKPAFVCPYAGTAKVLNVVTDTGKNYASSLTNHTDWVDPAVTDNVDTLKIVFAVGGKVVDTVGGFLQFPMGNTSVLLAATDAAANVLSCTIIVQVKDVEKPKFTCPYAGTSSRLTISTDAGKNYAFQVTKHGSWVTPAVTDNVDTLTIVFTVGGKVVDKVGGFQQFPLGDTTVNLAATDAAGNKLTCDVQVRVIDTEKPVFTCPYEATGFLYTLAATDIGLPYKTGVAELGTWVVPTVTDNVNTLSIQFIFNGTAVTTTTKFQMGNTTVLLTTTDAAGNNKKCSIIVSVLDSEKPVLTCPVNQTVATSAGKAFRQVTLTGVKAVDNSGENVESTVVGLQGQHTYFIGLTSYTYKSTDKAGNTGTCTVYVLVEDREKPVAKCPASQTLNVLAAKDYADVVLLNAGLTDNDNVSTNALLLNLTIAPKFTAGYSAGQFRYGDTVVRYSTTDPSGNEGFCNITVQVVDNIDPVVSCPYSAADPTFSTFSFTDLGKPSAAKTLTNAAVSDNSKETLIAHKLIGAKQIAEPYAFPIGSTIVSYKATDSSGRSGTCNVTVTVSDKENPTLKCPTLPDYATDFRVKNRTFTLPAPIASDNSGETVAIITVINANNKEFSGNYTFPLGGTVVKYKARDLTGNEATCLKTVRILDKEAPVLTCPADKNQDTDAKQDYATVNLPYPGIVDNSGGSLSPTARINGTKITGPTKLKLGTYDVIYTATDSASNSASCTMKLHIGDTQAPVLNCPVDQTVVTDASQAYASVTLVTQDRGVGLNVSDNSGEQLNITIAPGLVNTTGCNTGDPNVCVNVKTDVVVSNGHLYQIFIGTNTITYLATDSANNTGNCTITVEVKDQEGPIVTCPSNQTVNTKVSNNYAVVTLVQLTSDKVKDNSGAILLAFPEKNAGTYISQYQRQFIVGNNFIKYESVDSSGNGGFCYVNIAVIDNEKPKFTCPYSYDATAGANLVTIATDAKVSYASQIFARGEWVDPKVTDNVDQNINVTVSNSLTGVAVSAATQLAFGSTNLSLTATDATGNNVSCVISVKVVDKEAPVFTCPYTYDANVKSNVLLVPTNAGKNFLTNVTAYSVWIDPKVTDNVDAAGSISVNFTDSASGKTIAPDTVFPFGDSNLTLHVIDVASNEFSCDIRVRVIDKEAPTFTCPYSGSGFVFDLPTDDLNNFATDVMSQQHWVSPVVADNVDNGLQIVVLANSITGVAKGTEVIKNTSFLLGSSTINLTATDLSGNLQQCIVTVRVDDREMPSFTCPYGNTSSTFYVPTNTGQRFATAVVSYAGWTVPVIKDNVDLDKLSPAFALVDSGAAVNAATNFDLGTTLVNVSARDTAGNVNWCNVTVDIVDLEKPNFTCPYAASGFQVKYASDYRKNYTTGLPEAASWVDPTVTDNVNVTGLKTVLSVFVDGVSTSIVNSTPVPIGVNLVNVSATDSAGNVVGCQIKIEIDDQEKPRFECPYNATGGVYTVATDIFKAFATKVPDSAGWVKPIVYDNIDATGAIAVKFSLDEVRKGEVQTVTTSATKDNLDGTFTLSFGGKTSGSLAKDASAADVKSALDGLSTITAIGVTRVVVGQTPKGYAYTVTFDGLSSGAVGDVSNIGCDKSDLRSPGSATSFAGVADCVVAELKKGVFTPATGLEVNSSTVFPLGLTKLKLLATDTYGNSASCKVTILVADVEAPRVQCPADQVVKTDKPAGAEKVGKPFSTFSIAVATVQDNSGDVLQAIPTVLGSAIGKTVQLKYGSTHQVLYTATDDDGKVGNCTQSVKVEDNENPVLDCPTDQLVLTDVGKYNATVTLAPALVYDNSGENITITADYCAGRASSCVAVFAIAANGAAPKSGEIGTTVVTYSASDGSNNTGSCIVRIVTTERDDCASNPCQKGGTCTDLAGRYQCTCPPGSSGGNCELDTDECASNPCQNGATCTDSTVSAAIPTNKYECACAPRFEGFNCETLFECKRDTNYPCNQSLSQGFKCEVELQCVDPFSNVTNDFYCRCPTCVETVLGVASAASVSTYIATDPSLKMLLRNEVSRKKEFQIEGSVITAPFSGVQPVCAGATKGCTSSSALNYNALASVDDGSCLAKVPGCTNSSASNFNSLANYDDGTLCKLSASALDECTLWPCNSTHHTCQTPSGKSPAGESGWNCTDKNLWSENSWECSCPYEVSSCGQDMVFADVSNYLASRYMQGEEQLQTHLLGRSGVPIVKPDGITSTVKIVSPYLY